ncbi:MAG: hypothetical protein R2813_03910 [Flavobacteriales bacterium]
MKTEQQSDKPSDYEYNKSDYRNRHQFWAGQTLTQFGNSNNFFIIVGFAVLGYLVKELDQFGEITITCSWHEIDPRATFLVLALIFTFLSLVSGTLTMLSRLYDLRLTRHINIIRIKVYSEKFNFDRKLPDQYIDIKGDLKFPEFHIKLWKNFWGTIVNDKCFLTDKDLDDVKSRHEKFLKLRERTLMLGRFSWISFKWQIIWVALGLLTFTICWK